MQSLPENLLVSKSPKLHSFFAKKHPSKLQQAISAFEMAADHDGIREFGFERKVGINFNPRPARIPLIADQFNDGFEPDLFVACILTSIPAEHLKLLLPNLELTFNKNIHQLLQNFIQNQDSIERSDEINSETSRFYYLNIFNFLDRLRHSHLANKIELDYCLRNFEFFYRKIPPNQTKLALVFKTWHKRSQINLERNKF